MAKVVLSDVTSLANNASAKQTLNDNSAAVEEALENTLSRDGTGPNAMEAELDMGDHKVLNVADPVSGPDAVNLRSVQPLVAQFAGEIAETIVEGTLRAERFIATAGQTDFPLIDSPGTPQNAMVFDSGVFMWPGVDYTLSGSDLKTLTFLTGRAEDAEIQVRYVQLSPADSLLRADLLSPAVVKGDTIVTHLSDRKTAPSAAYLKTTSDIINGREVSMDVFLKKSEIAAIRAGTSVYDAAADFQDAFNAASASRGIQLLITEGLYNIPSNITTAQDHTHIHGVGRPKLMLGAGQAAGYITFLITKNHFSADDLRIESLNRVHTFYVQPQSASPLTGFRFERLEGNGMFYLVRVDGAADRKVHDVLVRGNKNVASITDPAGHFLVDYGVGVQYLGNTIQGGRNTSGYGVADSTNIAIVGNMERGMTDTVALTEAAAQIEDSLGADAVIAGNSFEHDIWVAGSSDVIVTGNTARRLRVSIGNADGYSVDKVLFNNNRAGQIHVAKFGSTTPPERITARFANNILTPGDFTLNGVPLVQAIYAEGAWINELVLRGNQTSNASTNAVVLSRHADALFRFHDNDFGSLVHAISGSGGRLYESGNRNPITKSANNYLEHNLTSTFAISAGAWQDTVLNNETVDVNSEWVDATFTPKSSGVYRFAGVMTVDPDAAGSQLGFRLVDGAGGSELVRLAFLRAEDANQIGVPLVAYERYMTAGESVKLQHFFTGATTQFVTGAPLCWFQVKKVD